MPNGQGWICKGSEENRHEAEPLPDYMLECPICGLSRQSPTEPTTKNTAPKAKSEKLQDQSIEKDDKKIEDSLDSFHKAFQSLIAIILLFSENIWHSFVGIILAVLFFIPWDKIKNLFITLWTKGKNLKSNRCLNRLILFFFVIFISFMGKVIKDRIDDPCKTLFSTTCTTEDLINSFYKGNQIEGFYTFLRRKNQPELKTQVLYHDIRQKNLFENCSKSEESEATFNKFWSLAVSPPNGDDANYWASGVGRKREGDSNTDESMAVVWDEFGKIYAQGKTEDKETIHSLAFSSQSCLVTGQENGSIGTWAFGKNPNRIDTINVSLFRNQETTHISSDGNSRVLITDKGRNAKIVSIDNCSIDETETDETETTQSLPEEFANKILVADFLPSDSQWIVTVLTDSTLNFWKIDSKKPHTTQINSQINSQLLSQAWLSVSQDGEYLLVGYKSDKSFFIQAYKITLKDSLPQIELVHLEGLEDKHNRVEIENEILDIAVTHENDRLIAVVAGKNGLFKRIVIDPANPLNENKYKYYEYDIVSPYKDTIISGVEFNPEDPSQFVSLAHIQQPPILWDLAGSRNEYIKEKTVPENITKILTRTAHTVTLLTLSDDDKIKRYNSALVEQGDLRDSSLNSFSYIAFGVADDQKKEVITINSNNQFQLWDPDKNDITNKTLTTKINEILTIDDNSQVKDMVYAPGSAKILALSLEDSPLSLRGDNKIKIINLKEEKEADPTPQSVQSIEDMHFSKTGKYFGAIVQYNSDESKQLVIWNLDKLFKEESPPFTFEQYNQYISFDFDPTDETKVIALNKDYQIEILSLENGNNIKFQSILSLPELEHLNRSQDYLNQKKWNKVLFSKDKDSKDKDNPHLILVGENQDRQDRDLQVIIVSVDWNKTKSKKNEKIIATVSHIFEGDWDEITDIKSYFFKSSENTDNILFFSDNHKHLIRLDLLEHNTLINNGIEWSKDYKSNRDGICTAE